MLKSHEAKLNVNDLKYEKAKRGKSREGSSSRPQAGGDHLDMKSIYRVKRSVSLSNQQITLKGRGNYVFLYFFPQRHLKISERAMFERHFSRHFFNLFEFFEKNRILFMPERNIRGR